MGGRAAVYLRVSKGERHTDNQRPKRVASVRWFAIAATRESLSIACDLGHPPAMRALLSIGSVAILCGLVHAQPRRLPEPDIKLDAAVRGQVIDAAIAALGARYVFPDVAKQIETSLRDRVKVHAYDNITSSMVFAEQLTKDLQAVSHDKHMRVFYSSSPIPPDRPDEAPASPEDKAREHVIAARFNGAFVKVERLDGNIGYVRVDAFMSPDELGPRAAAAISFVADTDALILDLRENHGGHPASVAILVSYLYDDTAEIHINDIYWRPDGTTHQFWALQSLPGRRYPNKPVYVLTSKETFSGGEEFAYDVKNLKRGTLVGETTGGGANPGGASKVGEHFALFVPMGRAISPVTKTSWEGTGVQPDITVPAAKALDAAYLAALKLQRAKYTVQDAPNLRDEIDQGIKRLEGRK
jgi:hypothetical protein